MSSLIPSFLAHRISETIIPDVKTTLNLFGIHMRKVSGEWDYPEHSHPQYEINYVLEGEQSIMVNNCRYIQRAGDLVLLRPGDIHSSQSGDGKPFVYFCIHFDIDDIVFLASLSRLEQVIFPSGTAVASQAEPHLGRLVEISRGMTGTDRTTLGQRMRLQSAVFDLFGQLWEALYAEAGLQSSISSAKVELAHQIQSRLRGILFQQFKQNGPPDKYYGITAIAAEFGISASHCNRVFRQVFGISPRMYLSQQMLHEAKLLLDNPRMSINQISAILGYRDMAHFSRQFKRWYGKAPSEYRRLNQEGQ